MIPEAQRIAIAEACGWTAIVDYSGLVRGGKLTGILGSDGRMDIPDYPNDIRAMHEAEEMASQCGLLKAEAWVPEIWRGCELPLSSAFWTRENMGCMASAIHATAAQRAEAFLRTLGKWTE